MFTMVDCDASVVINEKVLASRVSIGIDPDGNCLYVKVGERSKLFVNPFTPQMITRWDSAQMRAGVNYTISGTNVGFWSSGPLGHPGDGEFENRHFKSIAIRIKYSPMMIVVSLSGDSEQGHALFKGQLDPDNRLPLPSWSFEVEFSLPRASMNEFFALREGFFKSFEQRLDQCSL